MIIVIVSRRCFLPIVIIIVITLEEVYGRHVALPNYLETFSLFCSPWVQETVTTTIHKKALIMTENFD